MIRTSKPKASNSSWGGARQGSGRKPQWPAGTELKSMRLPASLEDELRQYAHRRLAEIQYVQAKAAARKTAGVELESDSSIVDSSRAGFPSSPAGPPPPIKHVRMDKIDARHYRIVHQERTIGHVSRMSDGRWGAWLLVPDDEEPFYVNGPTRRRAVSDLLEAEQTRWHRDGLGELYRDDGEA